MSEPLMTIRSALPGVRFQGRTTVSEAGLRGMVTLRGDLGSPIVQDAVRAAVGLEVPAQRRIVLKGENGVGWMAPDELILMMPHAMADAAVRAAQEALCEGHAPVGHTPVDHAPVDHAPVDHAPGVHALVVNVSDARCVFRLSGAEAVEVLARLAPVDMAALADDELRRTRLAQVPAAFWRSGADSFDLVAFRSVAGYVFELLKNAAASPPVGFLVRC